jgi:hypothetical protein
MKKYLNVIILSISLFFAAESYAIDSKLRVVGTMAGYGVVGGALLGTASLAFGTNGRSIAKGASLGLYAGLLFGGYIVLGYEMKKRGFGVDSKEDYYPDSRGQYEGSDSYIKFEDLEQLNLVSLQKNELFSSDKSYSFNFLNIEF